MDTPPPFPVSAPPPLPAPKSGAARWVFIAVGGCLTLFVVGGLGIAGIIWMVMGAVKSTDVYAEAFKRMQSSPQVQEALGTPVEAGWLFQGSVNYNNGAGTADMSIPLSGPRGEATLVAKAAKQPGEAWQYSVLEVRVSGGSSIDLRDNAPPP